MNDQNILQWLAQRLCIFGIDYLRIGCFKDPKGHSTCNWLPQEWKHSPTASHGLIQTSVKQDESPAHLIYITV